MLNCNVKLWTKHFLNCTTFDIDDFIYKTNQIDINYISFLCSKINLHIDIRQYQLDFLSVHRIKKHLRKPCSSVTSARINNKKNISRVRTITHYFKPIIKQIVKKDNEKTSHNQQNRLPSFSQKAIEKTFFRE
jgi:hypothetical protein